MGHFQLFSMILKFSMGHFLSLYTDFDGPFFKLMGLWQGILWVCIKMGQWPSCKNEGPIAKRGGHIWGRRLIDGPFFKLMTMDYGAWPLAFPITGPTKSRILSDQCLTKLQSISTALKYVLKICFRLWIDVIFRGLENSYSVHFSFNFCIRVRFRILQCKDSFLYADQVHVWRVHYLLIYRLLKALEMFWSDRGR